jgi:hypothetical protein
MNDKLKKKVIGEGGAYYHKYDVVQYEGDTKSIEKIRKENMPPSFKERIDLLEEWAKSILRDSNLPDTAIVKAPEGHQGGFRIDYHVEKVLKHDADSILGLAARIVALTDTIKANGASHTEAFELGGLSERLRAWIWWGSGPKNNRMDMLSKAMLNTWREFARKHHRHPKAFELWEALPIDRHIQEKEIDDRTIYWIRGNGGQARTSFKSFQNRYTKLRKKYK